MTARLTASTALAHWMAYTREPLTKQQTQEPSPRTARLTLNTMKPNLYIVLHLAIAAGLWVLIFAILNK